MQHLYKNILFFITLIFFNAAVSNCSSNAEDITFSDPVKEKYWKEVDRIGSRIAGNKVKPGVGGNQILQTRFCRLYQQELKDLVLCNTLVEAAFMTARENGDGEFFVQALKVIGKKNADYYFNNQPRAGNSGINLQALEIAKQLLSPQGVAPSSGSGGGTAVGVAFLKSSYISGLNRICVYDRLGSQVVNTIGSTQMCAMTLP